MHIEIKLKADNLNLGLLLSFLLADGENDFSEFLDTYSVEDYQKVMFAFCPNFLPYFVVALLH